MESVVAGVLLRVGREVLLARRSTTHAGFWEFPGGLVEPNELPEQAIVREFHEEFLVEVRVLRKVDFTYALSTERELHFFLLSAEHDPQVTHHSHDQIAWITEQSILPGDVLPADLAALPVIWQALVDVV
ncbi:MAG: NUDIX domain-containing protein [Actinobacteria bacterium]|nr:NUDIX domain-containing protein [Actinomycetota bacterium]